ncbi:peptide transporter [Sulfodiicoccus acidiphilus]|uniref:dolichyl-phosphooligosaccharide-protein glycotransferase n=1 Tax=Sulfodiicoccus acidiphilus TaxID=1670455 RepID=A0A348B351_9CREN|nr:peptide transporter [Sulfodiicoccus acidiphilus]GGT93397.1 peptide transporter [Sulfodiicoccus acidiphilus]
MTDALVVTGIVVISMLIRGLSAGYPLAINGFDSWYLFYNALLITHAGGNWYAVPPDVHAWYPWGYFIEKGDTIGLPFLVALVSMLLGNSANSVYTVTMYADIFLAGMGVVAAYLVGEALSGSKGGGYIAALLVAFSPALTSKNIVGGLPKSSWGGLLVLFTIYLMYVGSKKGKAWYGIPAGVVLFLAEITWGGNTYIIGTLAVAAILTVLLNRNNEVTAKLYTVAGVTTAFLTSLAPNSIGFMSGAAHGLGFLLVGVILYIDLYLKKHLPKEYIDATPLIMGALGVILVGLVLVGLVFSGKVDVIPTRYFAIINPFYQATVPIDKTVAEYIPQSVTSMIRSFGTSLLLLIPGVYFILRRGNLAELWLLALTVVSVYGTSEQPYLFNYTAYVLAATAGVGAGYIISTFYSNRTIRMSKALPAVFIALVAFSMAADAAVAVQQSNIPNAIVNSASPYPYPSYAWIDALDWINNHTPTDSVIFSWWDYGYWIQVVGNRTVIDENNTLNGTQIRLMADMFLNNESVAANILERNFHLYPYGNPNFTRPVYIVAYDTVTEYTASGSPQWYLGYPPSYGSPFVGYTTSFGDIAKMGAMMTIAGYPLSDFLNDTLIYSAINQTQAQFSNEPQVASFIESSIVQATSFAWTNRTYQALLPQMFIEALQAQGGTVIQPFSTRVLITSSQILVVGNPLPTVQLHYFQPVYIAMTPLVSSNGTPIGGPNYVSYVMVIIYQFVQPGYIAPVSE